jgi:serine/threonine protein kinase
LKVLAPTETDCWYTAEYMQVWRGKVMHTNKIVAVKFATSPLELMRLIADSGLVAGLKHPNIVQALGWINLEDKSSGESAQINALVLEYCPAGDLWDEIVKHQKPGVHNRAATGVCDKQRYTQFKPHHA